MEAIIGMPSQSERFGRRPDLDMLIIYYFKDIS